MSRDQRKFWQFTAGHKGGGGGERGKKPESTPSASRPQPDYQLPGGSSGEGCETGRSAPETGENARGIWKDLWPKYFPKCPVARHFV